jgi:hypothetical protein
MAKHKSKNPKARQSAAKRMLMMAMKKKTMMKGAVTGNGNGSKVAAAPNMPDTGNPGQDLK